MTPSESSKSGSARYEIREKIGTGGAGTVYKAWDTQLHRNVAFKRLNPTDSPDETNVDQMWKEAMTLAAFLSLSMTSVFISENLSFS